MPIILDDAAPGPGEPLEIITADDLVAYPGAGAPAVEAASTWAALVNGLVTEAWKAPVTPVPFWVKVIALEAAARAARNPKALQSWTRTVDDATRTERYSEAALARVGVYLTDDEEARLGGRTRRRRRYGTVRTRPGY
ncbi:hypothetical protein QWY28_17345 [Nocardioides sp. SOB77]|uniref:Uncharacterized protein n=1 Tax=Nocardioides oceani TaxID=3058369 RepID=A0ABT8FJM5_9ACTN|nr:hypothetical protein [Nocardioides oceani]MDN4174730.1 hypothetical protein [Nocardioides oceani]